MHVRVLEASLVVAITAAENRHPGCFYFNYEPPRQPELFLNLSGWTFESVDIAGGKPVHGEAGDLEGTWHVLSKCDRRSSVPHLVPFRSITKFTSININISICSNQQATCMGILKQILGRKPSTSPSHRLVTASPSGLFISKPPTQDPPKEDDGQLPSQLAITCPTTVRLSNIKIRSLSPWPWR